MCMNRITLVCVIGLHVMFVFLPSLIILGAIAFIAGPLLVWLYNSRRWNRQLVARLIVQGLLMGLLIWSLSTHAMVGIGAMIVYLIYSWVLPWSQIIMDRIYLHTPIWIILLLIIIVIPASSVAFMYIWSLMETESHELWIYRWSVYWGLVVATSTFWILRRTIQNNTMDNDGRPCTLPQQSIRP